uniref:Uncharacterized protein n=1 Tax=Oryza punctata TaxID=4537 RepID=A0A0E0LRN1_ORYPU
MYGCACTAPGGPGSGGSSPSGIGDGGGKLHHHWQDGRRPRHGASVESRMFGSTLNNQLVSSLPSETSNSRFHGLQHGNSVSSTSITKHFKNYIPSKYVLLFENLLNEIASLQRGTIGEVPHRGYGQEFHGKLSMF